VLRLFVSRARATEARRLVKLGRHCAGAWLIHPSADAHSLAQRRTQLPNRADQAAVRVDIVDRRTSGRTIDNLFCRKPDLAENDL
jgi:hypothetical protein